MAEEKKVGVAGLTHGHVWGLIESFRKVEGVRMVAVADETPLMENAKEKFERTYTDWREMLAKEELDALVVTSDNLESADITVEALKKGIPCLVEKPMAANVADAERMLAAAKESGARRLRRRSETCMLPPHRTRPGGSHSWWRPPGRHSGNIPAVPGPGRVTPRLRVRKRCPAGIGHVANRRPRA